MALGEAAAESALAVRLARSPIAGQRLAMVMAGCRLRKAQQWLGNGAHRIRAHFEDRPRGVSAHSCIPFVPSIASPSDSPLKILHMGSTVVVRSARRACIPSGEHGHELMSHSRVRFRVEDRCSLTPACSRLRARSALSGGARPAPAARCKMSEAVAIHPPRGRTSEHGASQPRHCAASDAMLARRCNTSWATGPSPGRHRSSRTMGGVNEPRRTWLEMNSDMSTTFRRSTLPPQSESTPGTVVSILADGCSCVPKKHRKPLVASVSGLS